MSEKSKIALQHVRDFNKAIKKLLKKLAVPYNTIYNMVQHYKETGSTADRPQSGRLRLLQPPKAIKRTQENICQNPVCSIQEMAEKEGVSIFKEDLKIIPFKRVRQQQRNEATRVAHKERGRTY